MTITPSKGHHVAYHIIIINIIYAISHAYVYNFIYTFINSFVIVKTANTAAHRSPSQLGDPDPKITIRRAPESHFWKPSLQPWLHKTRRHKTPKTATKGKQIEAQQRAGQNVHAEVDSSGWWRQ